MQLPAPGGSGGVSVASSVSVGGSPPQCTTELDCPGDDLDCDHRVCELGVCGTELAAEGTACDDFGGSVCDATGHCVGGQGDPCMFGGDCANGPCVDGVCCDSACDGFCEACAESVTGQPDGTCAPAPEGSNPAGECDGLMCDGSGACVPRALWSKSFGGIGHENGSYLHAAGGSLLLMPPFTDAVDFGDGQVTPTGFFGYAALKLDESDGALVWHLELGSSANHGLSVADTSPAGDLLIVGSFEGVMTVGGNVYDAGTGWNGIVIELDASGNVAWSMVLPSIGYGSVAGAFYDASGDIVLSGILTTSIDIGTTTLTGAGGYDTFVAKLTGSGSVLWTQHFGGAGDDLLSSLVEDAAGNIVVAGVTDGTVDLGGGPLTSVDDFDAVIARLTPDGNHVWSHIWGSTGVQSAYLARLTPSGELLVLLGMEGTVDFGGGPLSSTGGFDFVLLELDGNGQHQWSRIYGGPGDDYAGDMLVAPNGSIYMMGSFPAPMQLGDTLLTNAGDYDMFLAKFDASGNTMWAQRHGDAEGEFGHGIGLTSGGNIAVSGAYFGTIDFGLGSHVSAGNADLFVAVFYP